MLLRLTAIISFRESTCEGVIRTVSNCDAGMNCVTTSDSSRPYPFALMRPMSCDTVRDCTALFSTTRPSRVYAESITMAILSWTIDDPIVESLLQAVKHVAIAAAAIIRRFLSVFIPCHR